MTFSSGQGSKIMKLMVGLFPETGPDRDGFWNELGLIFFLRGAEPETETAEKMGTKSGSKKRSSVRLPYYVFN